MMNIPVDTTTTQSVCAIRWQHQALELLDQRLLPQQEIWLVCNTAAEVATAIRDMAVRGAPAIGISAGYGVALAALKSDNSNWQGNITKAIELLAQSRPTAVNLFWALARMERTLSQCDSCEYAMAQLTFEAGAIHREDIAANHTMARLALGVINPQQPITVLTHCNAGALATGGYGTALGVVRELHKKGMLAQVYADETRPWLQGSRLTAWELSREGIPVTLNADGAAAAIMAQGKVSWVIVGADRIAANGDVANKIGTYSLAILARHHGIRFMVAAPASTVDMALANGSLIPIEQRSASELRELGGKVTAPAAAGVYNPVFDVTPAALIDAIVTECGVVMNPDEKAMNAVFG